MRLDASRRAPPATGQAQAIKRISLQRFDVPGTAHETVIGIAEIDPNTAVDRHSHPGHESGYLISGSFDLLIDGEAAKPLRAGDLYQIPPRTIHDAKTGAACAKAIATDVVEKGQPIASPAQ